MTAPYPGCRRARSTFQDGVPGALPRVDLGATTSTVRSLTMLWTILIIVLIVALALFILGRVRGGGSL